MSLYAMFASTKVAVGVRDPFKYFYAEFFPFLPHIAQCVLCNVNFSAQLNKLRPILKFEKYYSIEHIFVPAFYTFLSFSDFQTLGP